MKIKDPFEDLGKSAKALKAVLDANDETIDSLPPLERLMAQHIRKALKSRGENQ